MQLQRLNTVGSTYSSAVKKAGYCQLYSLLCSLEGWTLPVVFTLEQLRRLDIAGNTHYYAVKNIGY